MSTLFVSDLDGTLLNSQSRLSAESARLLNEAIAEGTLFSVATARTPATVAPLLASLNLSLPLAVMTGAALWQPHGGPTGTYTHIHQIPPENVKILNSIYTSHSLPAFMFTLTPQGIINVKHFGALNDLSRKFINERLNSPFKHFDVPPNGTSRFNDNDLPPALLFYSMQPTAEVARVYDEIKTDSRFRPNFYHDMYGEEIAQLEVFSPQASKANAIKTLKRVTGAEKVVVFGDNVNDLTMFETADIAVAVDNAIAEVKNRADIIIGSHDTDSVAKFIRDNA